MVKSRQNDYLFFADFQRFQVVTDNAEFLLKLHDFPRRLKKMVPLTQHNKKPLLRNHTNNKNIGTIMQKQVSSIARLTNESLHFSGFGTFFCTFKVSFNHD